MLWPVTQALGMWVIPRVPPFTNALQVSLSPGHVVCELSWRLAVAQVGATLVATGQSLVHSGPEIWPRLVPSQQVGTVTPPQSSSV